MASAFTFDEDTGTATGSPAKGTTRTSPATDANWKNSGVITDAYSDYPLTAGNNSYQKVIFGHFTGTFTTVSGGLFAHTATAFGTGLTLKGVKVMTGDSDRWLYVTPSATTDADLTVDMTSVTAIASGTTVYFGITGPEATGKASSCATSPCYTNYLTTQLQTTSSADAGDTAQVTLTLQYDET